MYNGMPVMLCQNIVFENKFHNDEGMAWYLYVCPVLGPLLVQIVKEKEFKTSIHRYCIMFYSCFPSPVFYC